MTTFAELGIEVGERRGVEVACQCPQCLPSRKNKKAKPLSANTEKGLFHCNHCGWAGSLSVGELTKAEIRKQVSRPVYVNDEGMRPEELYRWFEGRGIPREIVQRNGITLAAAYMPQEERFIDCIRFPFYKEGEVVNVKYRGFANKCFRQHTGAEKVFFGMGSHAEGAGEGSLVICEGEIDALSLQVAGVHCAVSVPDGAPDPRTKKYATKFDFLENCLDFLERFQRVVIAVDGDEPGKRLEEELVRRISPEKCCLVEWPEGCKDSNDVLVRFGVDALAEIIKNARPVPLEGVFEVADLAEGVMELYDLNQKPGMSTGWGNVDRLFKVSPGELIIVSGIPSHGKSEWMDALFVNMADAYGWPFGIFSPENFPVENHVAKIVEKHIGKSFRESYDRLNKHELVIALEWAHRHFYFAVHGDDGLNLDSILLRAKAMVQRYGIRGFLIDPWNEIDHSRPKEINEVEYISTSLTRIRRFGRKYGVAMFVVAHPQKLYRDKEGSYPVPTLYDINGGAPWRNKADVGIVIWRDVLDTERKTSVYVQKIKNRQNGEIGNATLYWTPKSGRYLEQPVTLTGSGGGRSHQQERKKSIADLAKS